MREIRRKNRKRKRCDFGRLSNENGKRRKKHQKIEKMSNKYEKTTKEEKLGKTL